MIHTMSARVVSKVELSEDISAFTLAAADGAFEGCEAGAHVGVQLSSELSRSYSLTDWDPAGAWVSLAVKREPEGRGGSLAMHALEVGQEVVVAGPRNNFRLVTESEPVVLIGGGIGVTPIYAMARVLQAQGREFSVHYQVRTRELAAFDPALRELDLRERYRLHCDDVDGLPDFRLLLKGYPTDAHFYVCGPEPMLAAVQNARREVGGTVIFERFSAVPVAGPDEEHVFTVVLDSTGDEHEIGPGQTILEVLRSAGHDIDFSCTEGVCGSCITDVIAGEIDHRDSVLTEEDHEAGDCMCLCVSRARSARLVLDL